MPRYDKYEPIAGGFRAKLQAALPLVNGGFFGAVSLNASGRVVPGSGGQTGIVGVLVKNVARGPIGQWDTRLNGGTPNPYAPIGAQALDAVDIMTMGEIVDLDKAVFVAGSNVYAAADGSLSLTSGTGKTLIGHTVEAGRLIVRIAATRAAQA
jgi:hypothetical protein